MLCRCLGVVRRVRVAIALHPAQFSITHGMTLGEPDHVAILEDNGHEA
jgi:hypothetical protein